MLRARRSEVDTVTCESEAWDEVRHDMTRHEIKRLQIHAPTRRRLLFQRSREGEAQESPF